VRFHFIFHDFKRAHIRGRKLIQSWIVLNRRNAVESRFFESPRKKKIGLKNRPVREVGVKLQCSTEERETTFE